jgi:hypothetical protein
MSSINLDSICEISDSMVDMRSDNLSNFIINNFEMVLINNVESMFSMCEACDANDSWMINSSDFLVDVVDNGCW